MKRPRSIREKISRWIIMIGVTMVILSCVIFYFLFVPAMKQEAVEQAENTNMEVIQQVDTLISFVQDYTENLALSIAQNQEILYYFVQPDEQVKNVASLQLNNLISYEGSIRCVMIARSDSLVLDSVNEVTEEDRKVLKTEWYQNLKESTFGRGVSGVYQVEINNAVHDTAAYVKNFYHENEKYTYIVFIELDNLMRNFQTLTENTLDYTVLLDSEKNIVCTSGNGKWQEKALEGIDYNRIREREDIKGGIRFLSTSVNSKWQVVSYVADSTIFMAFSYYAIGVMIVLCLFMLITLVAVSKVVARIIHPIGILSQSMAEVAMGNLDCRIEYIQEDEIGSLGRTFNQMAEELSRSVEVIAEKEKREQQIRFSLLISQIDPHFIYNTINSINYLARRKRWEDIIRVNSALIFILRDRLRINNIEFMDTIENERKVIEQYILIERYMYDGSLELIWDLDDELCQEQIPKNMIQPLVENALFHGLIDEESGELSGTVRISIVKKGDDIIVKVTDNGLGMDEEQLARVRNGLWGGEERGKKIGLSNIWQRLYYLYGSTDSLKIESEKNKGTCITLIFRKKYFE